MRIALVSQEYPPETAKGGIGTQTHLKAHGLAALGHNVHVISRSHAPSEGKKRRLTGAKKEAGGRGFHLDSAQANRTQGQVEVLRVPSFAHRLPLYTEVADWLTYSAEVAVALATLHARAPLDLVDFPEWGAEGYIHLLNRTEWNRFPAVVQLHGPLVMLAHTLGWPPLDSEFYRTGSLMERACLRLADAVFSSSRCSASWCATHYGLARERVPILHAGVDMKLFAPQADPKPDRPTIVFVGKIARNKGAFGLVEAACELAKQWPDLHLRMLGMGEERLLKELRKRAAASGHPQLLDLPGFVAREQLPAQLTRAHVFAAPSVYEGGPGFVYLEAMACGLPVIGCQGSGAAEVIRHDQTGLLIPPDDVGALTAALRRLLVNEPLRRQLAEKARRYALEEADSGRCVLQIEAFYRSVVERFHATP